MCALVSRNSAVPNLLPTNGASRRPCAEYGFTGATSTSRRTRKPGLRAAFPAQALRSRHHRDRAAMRSPQQIKRRNSQPLDEPQKPLRRPSHGMINPSRPIREPRTHHVRRINRSVRRQAPASYIARKTNIPATHAAESAPARTPRAGSACAPHQVHPALFHPRAQRRSEAAGASGVETSRSAAITAKSSHSESSRNPDNSFPLHQILFK